MIKISNNPKIVNKPWGKEFWIADGREMPFAFKKIQINAPYKSSIQFHEFKKEVVHIFSGKGFFHYSDDPIDIKRFKLNNYSQSELNEIVNNLNKIEISEGFSMSINPGFIHSVEAVEDITIFESSTTELDDVFRINDEFKRDHGHIESEHN